MAIILSDTVGRNLTVIVEVTLDTDRSEVVQEFERAIKAAPEVMQGYYVNSDFVLIVTAKNMQDYEEFDDRFLARRRHVKHFHTSVVMRRVKWGIAVPVNRQQM